MSAARTNRYMGATVARAGIARAVVLIGTVVALILIAAIVLTVLGASSSNGIVKAIHDAGRFLAGPFRGLFHLSSHKGTEAVNWGIAAVVWFLLAHFIGRLILRSRA
jgi:hypothetical protein